MRKRKHEQQSVEGREKEVSVEDFSGKRWGELYEKLVDIDENANDPGLKLSSDGKPADSSLVEDKIVFGAKPLLEPLVLVQCAHCKRRVKMDGFTRHAERCKETRNKIQSSSKRSRKQMTRGIPRGTRFTRGGGRLDNRPKNDYYDKVVKATEGHLHLLGLRQSNLPKGVNPLTIKPEQDKIPLLAKISNAQESKKDSKSKRLSKVPSSKSTQKEKKQTKNTKKESKEKRKKTKAESKKGKNVIKIKRSSKKSSKSRRPKTETDASGLKLSLGPSPFTVSLGHSSKRDSFHIRN